MNESCRICGVVLAAGDAEDDCVAKPVLLFEDSAVEQDETKGEEPSTPEAEKRRTEPMTGRRPLNIRWIAGAGVVLALLVGGAEMWAESKLKTDTEAWGLINDALVKAERGQELTDPEKERVRDALMGNGWMVPLLVVMFLVFPVGIGVLVGYATGSVRDGIIAVAGGMAGYIVFIAHYLPLVVVAVPLYSGIGALAALLGRRLSHRFNA